MTCGLLVLTDLAGVCTLLVPWLVVVPIVVVAMAWVRLPVHEVALVAKVGLAHGRVAEWLVLHGASLTTLATIATTWTTTSAARWLVLITVLLMFTGPISVAVALIEVVVVIVGP